MSDLRDGQCVTAITSLSLPSQKGTVKILKRWRSESIGKTDEVLLVDGFQNCRDRLPDDLVPGCHRSVDGLQGIFAENCRTASLS
jgi:hypothetical protein